MHRTISSRRKVGFRGAFFASLALLVALVITAPQVAQAQAATPTGDYLGTATTPPGPMDLAMLLAAIQGDPNALARFTDITEPPSTGQDMINAIINTIEVAIGGTQTAAPSATPAPEVVAAAITDISAANPAVVTVPGTFVDGEAVVLSCPAYPAIDGKTLIISNVGGGGFTLSSVDGSAFTAYAGGCTVTTAVTDIVTKAAGGDRNALTQLQAAIAPAIKVNLDPGFLITSQGPLAAIGYQPGLGSAGPPAVAPTAVHVSNLGAQGLAFIVGGSGKAGLETIALAAQCNVKVSPAVCPNAAAANAKAILDKIFNYCVIPVGDKPPPPAPLQQQCANEDSSQFLSVLESGVVNGAVVHLDPTLCVPVTPGKQDPCTPLSLSEMIEAALGNNPACAAACQGLAQKAISTTIGAFLNGVPPDACSQLTSQGLPASVCLGAGDPTGDSYIGPGATAYLGDLFQNITVGTDTYTGGFLPPPPPPGSVGTTPVPPSPVLTDIGNMPIPGGGLYNIPYTAGNNVPASNANGKPDATDHPCGGADDDGNPIDVDGDGKYDFVSGPDWVSKDVKMQVRNGADAPQHFAVDPCRFTRETLNLDFALNFKGGEQWAGYFPMWVKNQWLPALRAMTAQWSAAIVGQTMLIGAAIDANDLAESARTIQITEVEEKTSVTPSEAVCAAVSINVPGDGVATGVQGGGGISNAQSASLAMSAVLKRNFEIHAGLGTSKW